MIIIDGKKISEEIQGEITSEVALLKSDGKKVPHLAAVLVGNNGASETYVNGKVKACEKVGFQSSLHLLPDSVSENDLLRKISDLNNDADVDGFIVQLPLPGLINVHKITEAISPAKDVDGFHPVNAGRMMQNIPCYLPATPYGILLLLERYKIETSGKHCVVLGRSNIVGLPVSVLLARNSSPGNCTVTVCHSKTKNIPEITLTADIIVAAIGKPEFLTADMVKDGAVVIDVGISRIKSSETKSGYRLIGDVKFNEVAPKCSYITPVPGGVGPMTITALLKNTLAACRMEIYK
ncbi:MAG TPA: tetrahydrofolate dehydrogenase/cyclohydrolase catalytic domain-containing protein [Bacteroidia bacterium]|nr:tetrahydrofolate dehydrogenase/cyclohydrolase catalytic domain-containing protein [Bacteroidia bacterium]